ncbi:MAG: POTRA domain-containing protein [Myxococcota bacterium]|nr:POTRA domain-containing protein [Myxococcota bacterium]
MIYFGLLSLLAALPIDLSTQVPEHPIVSVTFKGDRLDDMRLLRAAVQPLMGRTGSEANLRAAIRALEKIPRVSTVDFELVSTKTNPAHRELNVTIAAGPPIYVDRIQLELDTQIQSEDESLQTRRHMKVKGVSLPLYSGARYHPYTVRLERDAITAYYASRGFLGATVKAMHTQRKDLIRFVYVIKTGPKFTVREIRYRGLPLDVGFVGTMKRGRTATATDIQAERDALDARLCKIGYADANVQVQQDLHGRSVDLTFWVTAGKRSTVASFEFIGAEVPSSVAKAVAIDVGAPYCPRTIDQRLNKLRTALQEQSYLTAVVTPSIERAGSNVKVRFRTRDLQAAVISRIWFEGQKITHDKVLRQLITLKRGDKVRPLAVRRSVESLRRSGLFVKVSSRLVPSTDADRYFLIFEVEERDIFSVDVSRRILTLHNMNLFGIDDLRSAVDGVSARGAGETLSIRADSSIYSLALAMPYIVPNVLFTAEAALRLYDFNDLEETVVGVLAGAGFRSWNNVYTLSLLAELTHTVQDFPIAYDNLPIFSKPGFGPAIGLDAQLNLNRINIERIEYKGIHLRFKWLSSADILPGPPLSRWHSSLGFNLPLHRNKRGQHWVFHANAKGSWVAGYGLGPKLFTGQETEVYAHRRITPQARGYDGPSIRQQFTARDGTTVELGGLAAYMAQAELLIPLPRLRNAIVPFIDGATVGERSEFPWEDVFLSAGIALRFSLFRQRFEGELYLAVPFRDDVDIHYLGLGAGGVF